MTAETKLIRFARYAWFVLGWNILVILWGVFLRASKSGDGCGQHWLTCHGEVIPSAPQLKTVIEFSHRVTSAVDGLLIIVMLVWAITIWYSDRANVARRVMWMSIGSFLLVVVEGLLGAGLVLTANTAENMTPERPFWMAGHLVNTLILLTFLTLAAWYASSHRRLKFTIGTKYLVMIGLGTAAILFVGMSGSVAALSDMIFPAESLRAGLDQDLSPTSHIILRLRPLHPILATVSGVFLIFLAGWLKRESGNEKRVARWSTMLSIAVVAQVAFGAATLLLLAPIVLQLGHLFLADAIWICFVLLTANFLAGRREFGSEGLSPGSTTLV